MSRRDEECERPRMLRIEVHGLLHDWFDLDDLGDMVKSSGFNITLRENIARYFGVPVEQQALYDEDGLLATTADLRRALQRYAPKLYVYNFSEIGRQLHEKTSAQLAIISQQVAEMQKIHFNGAHSAANMEPQSRTSRSEVVYAVPLQMSNYEAAQDAGKAMKTAEPRPWVPPLQSFPSPEIHEDERNATRTLSGYMTHQRVTDDFVKKDFQPSQVLLANNSWQSCSATTDAAAEAVGSQVSSSPTALAAQVVTVASNTTLASDVRELTEVETWSIGDARRMPVVDAPRVNFDTRVQTASPCTSIPKEGSCQVQSFSPSADKVSSGEAVQVGTGVIKPCTRVPTRIKSVPAEATEPLQFVGTCQVQLPMAEPIVKVDHGPVVQQAPQEHARHEIKACFQACHEAAEGQSGQSGQSFEEFCPQCGNSYLPDAAFCRHCGRKRDCVAISAQAPVARPRGSSLKAAVLQPTQVEAPRVTPSPPRALSPPPSRSPVFAWPQTHLQPLSQMLSPAHSSIPLRQSSHPRTKEDTVYVTATSCMDAAVKDRSWK